MIGVFSSFIHGIGQFVHFKVAGSILVYIFMAYAIFLISRHKGIDFNGLVYLCLLVVVLNSAIILTQVSLPSFRDFIESFLVLSGNVNWTEGFRYRGLASGGGASLSVLIPVAVVLALYLYSEKVIGLLNMAVLVSILLVSLFLLDGLVFYFSLSFLFLLFF